MTVEWTRFFWDYKANSNYQSDILRNVLNKSDPQEELFQSYKATVSAMKFTKYTYTLDITHNVSSTDENGVVTYQKDDISPIVFTTAHKFEKIEQIMEFITKSKNSVLHYIVNESFKNSKAGGFKELNEGINKLSALNELYNPNDNKLVDIKIDTKSVVIPYLDPVPETDAKAQEDRDKQIAILYNSFKEVMKANCGNLVEFAKTYDENVFAKSELHKNTYMEAAKNPVLVALKNSNKEAYMNLAIVNRNCFKDLMDELTKSTDTNKLEAEHSKTIVFTWVMFAASLVSIFIAASNNQALNNFAVNMSHTSKISPIGKLITSCLQLANRFVATNRSENIAIGIACSLSLLTLAGEAKVRSEALEITDKRLITVETIKAGLGNIAAKSA